MITKALSHIFLIAAVCGCLGGCEIDQDALTAGLTAGLASSAQIQAGEFPIADSGGILAEKELEDGAKYFPEIDLDKFNKNGHTENSDTLAYAMYCSGKTLSGVDRHVCEKYSDNIGVETP